MDENLSIVSEAAVAYYRKTKLSVYDILDVEADQLDEPLHRVKTFRNGLKRKSFENLKEVTGLDYNTLA